MEQYDLFNVKKYIQQYQLMKRWKASDPCSDILISIQFAGTRCKSSDFNTGHVLENPNQVPISFNLAMMIRPEKKKLGDKTEIGVSGHL